MTTVAGRVLLWVCFVFLSAVPAMVAADPAVTASNMWAMTRSGDERQPPLSFAGFGRGSLVASSHELTGSGAWTNQGSASVRTVENFRVQVELLPADWAAVRSRIPRAASGSVVTVKRLMWNGVSAWRIDTAVAPNAPEAARGMWYRALLAPLETGFLMMSFQGPGERVSAARAALLQEALSVRFRFKGLIAEYYGSPTLEWLSSLQIDPCIDFDWGAEGGPANGVGPDTFSVRWTGRVRPPVSGTYVFTTLSDDGIRLWVNGKLLAENWSDHPATEASGQIDLEAGKEADLKVEWYENLVHAVARLMWLAPGGERQVIPATCLSACPEPGLALPPELGSLNLGTPAGWPELICGELPGGYTLASPAGMPWRGQRPHHTAVIGDGAVDVALRMVRVSTGDAASLLPERQPKDQFEFQKVAWKYSSGGEAASQPGVTDTLPVVEHFASSWSVECSLDAESHPETKQLYRWYCLVPMKRGLLVLSFASEDKDWCKTHWGAYLDAFNSITLTAVEQKDDTPEAKEPLF